MKSEVKYLPLNFSVLLRLSSVALAKMDVSRAIIVSACFILNSVFLSAETPYYHHTPPKFEAVTFDDLPEIPTEYQLNEAADKLTDIVKGSIKINSNETYAIERQMALPICRGSALAAWNAALAYNWTPSNYPGKIFDNVGWVRGTLNTVGGWSAYLWVLQNKITFQSSTSVWWTSTNLIPVAITNVFVGSLGTYGPVSNVVDIGPIIPSNFPGLDQGNVGTYQVDITNIFYELSIPDIWITPREAYTAVGGSNVQFAVTGTNIPQGVTWTLIPDLSGSGGAVIQSNGAWQAEVAPGSVGTNYIVRATSVDNTNFYDQVNLTILKVDIVETQVYALVEGENVEFHIASNCSANINWKIIPEDANGPYVSGSDSSSAQIGPGFIASNFTVMAYSSDNTNFYDTAVLKVVKLEISKVEFTSDHGVLIDYSANYAGTNGPVYNPRGWIKGGSNNPITHVKGTNIIAKVTWSFQPSGLEIDLLGTNTISALTFAASNITSTGVSQTNIMISAGQLPAKVDILEENIAWSFNLHGVTNFGNEVSGSHQIFIMWDDPGEGPTFKRMNWACSRGDDAVSPDQCASQLWDAVAAETVFSNENIEGWALLDGGSGDCDNQAKCMKAGYEMLGAGIAQIQLVHASTNAGVGNCLDFDVRSVSNQTQYLIMDFNISSTNHDWNAYEGCCEAANKYHAITPKKRADNDYDMLKAIGCRQFWVKMKNDIPPGDYGWDVEENYEEVPVP